MAKHVRGRGWVNAHLRIICTVEKVRSEHENTKKEGSCFPLHRMGSKNNSPKDISSEHKPLQRTNFKMIIKKKKKNKSLEIKERRLLNFRRLLQTQADHSSSQSDTGPGLLYFHHCFPSVSASSTLHSPPAFKQDPARACLLSAA